MAFICVSNKPCLAHAPLFAFQLGKLRASLRPQLGERTCTRFHPNNYFCGAVDKSLSLLTRGCSTGLTRERKILKFNVMIFLDVVSK